MTVGSFVKRATDKASGLPCPMNILNADAAHSCAATRSFRRPQKSRQTGLPICPDKKYSAHTSWQSTGSLLTKPEWRDPSWSGEHEEHPAPLFPFGYTPMPYPGNIGAQILADYAMILETTPAPTVRPPSRIAKRRPSSMATGLIRVTTIFTLSPGITISTPSGSSQAPVMSVVRK